MTLLKSENNNWVNLKHFKEEDALKLKRKYKFHALDLEDCLSESQRPKIDEYNKYLFIILHFPYYNKKTKHIATEQVNIFIGENYLITIHNGHLSSLDDLFKSCQKNKKIKDSVFGGSSSYLLYSIINTLFVSLFKMTDSLQKSLLNIEKSIFESKHIKDELFDIMVMKNNIITFRKIIFPQRTVVASLEHKQKRFLVDNLDIYFDDVVDQVEKLWNILETQKEIIESLEDTNESLLSHKLNNTMRTLTVFSVIMLPLTFLTGLFGMNVALPFKDATKLIINFWYIVISMLLIAILMIIFFKRNKWM